MGMSIYLRLFYNKVADMRIKKAALRRDNAALLRVKSSDPVSKEKDNLLTGSILTTVY